MKTPTFLQLPQLSFVFILPLVCLASERQLVPNPNAISPTATTYPDSTYNSTVIQRADVLSTDQDFAYNIFYLNCVDDKNKIYQIKELKQKTNQEFKLDENTSVTEEHLYQALNTLFNQIPTFYQEIYHQDESNLSDKKKLQAFNKACPRSFKVQKNLLPNNELDQAYVFLVRHLNFTIENRQNTKQAELQDMGIHIALSGDTEKVPYFFFCLKEPTEVQIESKNKEEIHFESLPDKAQKDFLQQVALGKSFFTVCNESKNKGNKKSKMKDLVKKLKIQASRDLTEARLQTLEAFKGKNTKDHRLVFKYKTNTIEERIYVKKNEKNEKIGHNYLIKLVSTDNKDSNDKLITHTKSLSLRLDDIENKLSKIIEGYETDDLSDSFKGISPKKYDPIVGEVITRTNATTCSPFSFTTDSDADDESSESTLLSNHKNQKSKKHVTFDENLNYSPTKIPFTSRGPTQEIKRLKSLNENTKGKNHNLLSITLLVGVIPIAFIVITTCLYPKPRPSSRNKPTDQNKKTKGIKRQKRALSSR